MKTITAMQKESYCTEGYLVVKSQRVQDFKNILKRDLRSMVLKIIKNHSEYAPFFHKLNKESFAEIFDWCIQNERENAITRIFYELFPVNSSMLSLINDPFFVEISESLGISYPIPSTLPIVRIDRPNEAKFLTPAHQDYWFSMLSDNSLSYWFPVFSLTEAMGYLQVVPKSHKQGLLPFKKWTNENPFCLSDEIASSDYISVALQDDEVLVFSQLLVHKSAANLSQTARLTVQIRHNDLDTLKEQTSSFTPKQSLYTANAQKDWLEKSLETMGRSSN